MNSIFFNAAPGKAPNLTPNHFIDTGKMSPKKMSSEIDFLAPRIYDQKATSVVI